MSGNSGMAKRNSTKGPYVPACGPEENGAICSVTLGNFVASSSLSIWSRITSGPPTGRRTAVSSITAQNRGAPSRVSSSWRCMRSATWRSMSSGLVWPMAPDSMTPRAYSSVCSTPGTKWGSYERMREAAPSRLTYIENQPGRMSWNRCHQPGWFASSASATKASASSSETPYDFNRSWRYGILSATSAVSIRRTVAAVTRRMRAASSRLSPARSRRSSRRRPRTTCPTVGADRGSLTSTSTLSRQPGRRPFESPTGTQLTPRHVLLRAVCHGLTTQNTALCNFQSDTCQVFTTGR